MKRNSKNHHFMKLNQGYCYRHVLCPTALGQSTLAFLVQNFSHSNQAEWQSRMDAGEIVLDGKTATGTESIRAGSILIWNRPAWLEEDTPQEYKVLYQDKQLLAVDKPSGLPTIPGAGFYLNTLLSLVRSDFQTARPLHRLGRATSGLVLFALDTLYAAGGQPRTDQPGLPGDTGYWLHAKRLVFEHPVSADLLDLRAPLPDCLQIE